MPSRRDILTLIASLSVSPAMAEDTLALRQSRTLPRVATRVVALEFLIAETLAMLDRPPIGMSDPKYYPGWIGLELDRLAGVTDVGTRQQPSLEAIARLKPDLIIGLAYRHAPLFDVLESLAPTVLLEFGVGQTGTQLDAVLELIGMIGAYVGRDPEAAKIRAEVERSIAEDAARLAQAGRSGRRLVVLQELGGLDTYWVFTANSMSAGLAQRLGLDFWPKDRGRDGVRVLTSQELLALDDVDIALVSYSGPQVDLAAKTKSAAWAHVPALAQGRVTLIERNIWNFGGPASARHLATRLTDMVLAAP
ncbi:ABC transporter substrate-binding protein [Arboricoccus pini]|nr:iron-siderophore ABC transporter substrate-binding protein [Arboricoccus pini]